MITGNKRKLRSILIKETTMKLAPLAFILFSLIWFLAEGSDRGAAKSFVKSKLSLCQERPAQFTDPKLEIQSGLEGLPKGILIAKKAHYFVVDKKTGNKIMTEQDFVQRRSSILCASMDKASKMSFAMYAPVLLNLTGKQKVQDSNWQFQVMANPERIGMWNQKVRLGSPFKASGIQIKTFELHQDQYEILLTRESETSIESLLIRYDVSSGVEE